jgi:hypothetical protein
LEVVTSPYDSGALIGRWIMEWLKIAGIGILLFFVLAWFLKEFIVGWAWILRLFGVI